MKNYLLLSHGNSLVKLMILAAFSLQPTTGYSIEKQKKYLESGTNQDWICDNAVTLADTELQLRRMKKLVSNDLLDSNTFLKKIDRLRNKLNH